MDFTKVVQAIKRRRWVFLAGVVLGIALALAGMFRVRLAAPGSGKSGLVFTKRSFETYQTVLTVLVDAPDAAMGRTDVPITGAISLAPTYAYLATSDNVIRTVEAEMGGPLEAEVWAQAVAQSPIVQLTVTGSDPAYITKVAKLAEQAFFLELKTYQADNDIPATSRVVVRSLGPPSRPKVLQSRQYEVLVILFILPVLVFTGLAIVLDNRSRSRAKAAEPTADAPHEVPSTKARADSDSKK